MASLGSIYAEGVGIFLRAFSQESIRQLRRRLAEVLRRNLCGAGLEGKTSHSLPRGTELHPNPPLSPFCDRRPSLQVKRRNAVCLRTLAKTRAGNRKTKPKTPHPNVGQQFRKRILTLQGQLVSSTGNVKVVLLAGGT